MPQFRRRTNLLDLAVSQHHDPVGQFVGFGLVVGDVNRRHLQLVDQTTQLDGQLAAQRSIEGPQRLIEHEYPGRGSQGAGQSHPLSLAPRELIHAAVPDAGQADEVEQFAHPGRTSCRRARCQSEAHVARHIEVGEEGVSLEHQTHSPFMSGGPSKILPLDQDRSRAQRFEPGESPEQRGLPTAARTDHPDDFAAAHDQVDSGQRIGRCTVGPSVTNADIAELRSWSAAPPPLTE